MGAVTTPSTRRVLLIGAGGHARVCLEALLDMGDTEVVGALSADGTGIAGLGVPVLGTHGRPPESHEESFCDHFLCRDRRQLDPSSGSAKNLTESGHTLTHAVSRFAMLSTSASCGDGVQILAGSVVNAATVIGAGTIVNTNASVDHDCGVGDFVHVAPGATIGGGVTIGELRIRRPRRPRAARARRSAPTR